MYQTDPKFPIISLKEIYLILKFKTLDLNLGKIISLRYFKNDTFGL